MNITTLTESARTVRLLKIDGYPPYGCSFASLENTYATSRWGVHGYEWEIRFYPIQPRGDGETDMALELVFLSEVRGNEVTANTTGKQLFAECKEHSAKP
ncbi:hypothetical protein EJB05_01512, partial [Eragrostis curvula]